ncbi:MAG: hypothetical protein ACYTXA_27185 [Nostoc sp.]
MASRKDVIKSGIIAIASTEITLRKTNTASTDIAAMTKTVINFAS